MPKPKIKWRTVRIKSGRGSDYDCSLPDTLDVIFNGELHSRIQAMEKKKPILLTDAIQLVKDEVCECYKDKRLIEAGWNLNNFVQWISLKGYHIELVGNEFETLNENEPTVAFQYMRESVKDKARSKHVIKWRAYKRADLNGFEADEEMPILIDKAYRGALLSKILLMPEQTPISFEEAIKIAAFEADKAFLSKKFGSERGHHNWYINNFIEFIAGLGYHIELGGDEFELYGDYDVLM